LKSKKCISFGFKQFQEDKRPRKTNRKKKDKVEYYKLENKSYSAFDPMIKVGGVQVICLGPKKPVFKHLGRKFQFNLKDSSLRTEVLKKLKAMMTIVDDSMLTGSQKIWIVDNMVIPKISWDMLIQSFTQSEVSKWQAYLIKHYKKWSGLAASAETSIFFRRKENQGYGLKSLLDCNETQQIVKWMIMKESKDPQARRTFSRRLKRDEQGEIGRGRKTSTCLQIKELSSVVEFEEMRGEVRKRGSTEGVKTRRKSSNRTKVLNVCKRDQEEKRIVPLHAYQMQASWLVWSDKLDRELEKSVEWGKVMTSYSVRLLKYSSLFRLLIT
jgi:hypothetical protein